MSMTDLAYEAQACYSLGNTYTLMKDFPKAVDFYSRHLRYALQLQDRLVTIIISGLIEKLKSISYCRIGEARAYWSLGNAYTALGDYRQAHHFSSKHLDLAADIGDSEGVDTAHRNLADLNNMLQLQDK